MGGAAGPESLDSCNFVPSGHDSRSDRIFLPPPLPTTKVKTPYSLLHLLTISFTGAYLVYHFFKVRQSTKVVTYFVLWDESSTLVLLLGTFLYGRDVTPLTTLPPLSFSLSLSQFRTSYCRVFLFHKGCDSFSFTFVSQLSHTV